MNPIDSGRKFLGQIGNTAKHGLDKAQDAVGNVVDTARNTVVDGGRKVGQFVDGFEQKAAQGAQTVKGLFGGNKSDLVHDGVLVGANGTTYPPGTPLSHIPGVTPRNNPNPSETVIFVNGIATTKDSQANTLQALADKTGAKFIGIHNATEGAVKDVAQCVADKMDKGRNPAVDTLADTLYTELKAGRSVHLMAHSQGGLVTARALKHVYNRLRIEDGLSKGDTEKLMSKLNVETFAAASGHFPDGPNYVHYVNDGDPVPALFGLGAKGSPVDWFNHPGRGAVVHHFHDGTLNPFDGHGLTDVYMKEWVPFAQARKSQFDQ
ncbi:hypothetical protein P2318_20240 [Myxococcaceae bacterium GXIMD 01537]